MLTLAAELEEGLPDTDVDGVYWKRRKKRHAMIVLSFFFLSCAPESPSVTKPDLLDAVDVPVSTPSPSPSFTRCRCPGFGAGFWNSFPPCPIDAWRPALDE